MSQAFDEHQFYSSAIVLTAEAPTKDIEFRISPEASIAGVVVDEAGEPVRNAQIAANCAATRPEVRSRLATREAALARMTVACMSCRILLRETIG